MSHPRPLFESTIENVLYDLEQFCKANPYVTEEQVGWFCLKQRNLMERLRGGGDITTRKLDKVLRWLKNPVLTYKKEARNGKS